MARPGTALNGDSGRPGWISCISGSKAWELLGRTLEHATFRVGGVDGAAQRNNNSSSTVNKNLLQTFFLLLSSQKHNFGFVKSLLKELETGLDRCERKSGC